MFTDIDYTETDWRIESDAREIAELDRDRRDMEDVLIESTPRETRGQLVRASEFVSTLGWCDGSGFFEEQIDVDQFRGIVCMGCPACEEEPRTGPIGVMSHESYIESLNRGGPVEAPAPETINFGVEMSTSQMIRAHFHRRGKVA
jgi:hypothetical protein